MSLSKDIAKRYKACQKSLDRKIKRWMRRVELEHAQQLALLGSGAITPEAYRLWASGQLLHSPWAKHMARDLVQTIEAADKAAVKAIADAVPAIYTETEAKMLYAMDRTVGLGASFHLHNINAVAAAMSNDLLPTVDIGKNWAWNSRRLNSAITQSILKGESIPKIAKRIENIAAKNKAAAVRNARTAVNAAENAGKQAAYEEAEAQGLKVTKVWFATMDDLTRDSHVELDGEEVDVDEPFSNGCMYPCDPAGDPSEVYNCRCTMLTKVNGEEIDTSSRMNKTGMSYEEWKDAHKE